MFQLETKLNDCYNIFHSNLSLTKLKTLMEFGFKQFRIKENNCCTQSQKFTTMNEKNFDIKGKH